MEDFYPNIKEDILVNILLGLVMTRPCLVILHGLVVRSQHIFSNSQFVATNSTNLQAINFLVFILLLFFIFSWLDPLSLWGPSCLATQSQFLIF